MPGATDAWGIAAGVVGFSALTLLFVHAVKTDHPSDPDERVAAELRHYFLIRNKEVQDRQSTDRMKPSA